MENAGTGQAPLPPRQLRVGVVYGGQSGEHEVSVQSARAVMASLDQAGHLVTPILIARDGRWTLAPSPLDPVPPAAAAPCPPIRIVPGPGEKLVTTTPAGDQPLSVDVIFPVLHGTFGEDGTIQGLLELAGIPYVGSGVLGSSLGMDKVVQKRYWRGLGLPIVDFHALTRRRVDNDLEGCVVEIEQGLGYPCFTKPANLGSSVGVGKATDRAQLRAGLKDAARYDGKIVVERGLDVRELECGVLGNDTPIASVVGEIVPNADFYSYQAKYEGEGSRTHIPAGIPADVAQLVRQTAVTAFQSLDCAGLARADFFLERGTGRVLLNEINTMPGFTTISMYPKLWEASGVTFPELVDRLVQLALERWTDRARNLTTYHGAAGLG